jgi:hypothetical protein
MSYLMLGPYVTDLIEKPSFRFGTHFSPLLVVVFGQPLLYTGCQ